MNARDEHSDRDDIETASAANAEAPINRWLRPLARFLRIESASGVVLLGCTVVALLLANSPWAQPVADFWKTHVRVSLGPWALDESLLHWINDGLMTLFFFVVGLEIKRELITGELRDPRKAALPVLAAVGGMIVPALLYLVIARGGAAERTGWGVPVATDIAFVVGFLALLGQRVPFGLKILLLSLAIADDIGAVVVIACFYSTDISLPALGLAAAGLVLIFLLNQIGVRRVSVYAVVAAGVWLACLKSGIHPTVAGVALGLMTPVRALVQDRTLVRILRSACERLRSEKTGEVEPVQRGVLEQVETAAREAISPLERLEIALHPWVAFGIMPIFALANAGVPIGIGWLRHPVAAAVAAGLVVGKPLGILLFSWLAVRLRIARLPTGVNWKVMLGAGCLAGIGFTMSLFIAGLALGDDLLPAGKIGTLAGSAVSAALGSILLRVFLPRPSGSPDAAGRNAINKAQA